MRRLWIIRTATVGALALAVVASGCGGGDPAPLPPSEQPVVREGATIRTVLEIQGMVCSSCAATVRAMLERTPGVSRAEVSAERAEGIVEFDPTKVEPGDLVGVVERLGYRARTATASAGEGEPGA